MLQLRGNVEVRTKVCEPCVNSPFVLRADAID
jgi:hypothetical protein